MDFFAHRGWIESKLSRKFIHIGTGPIFVLCWLMFPDVPMSRYLAALVPLFITVQFFIGRDRHHERRCSCPGDDAEGESA